MANSRKKVYGPTKSLLDQILKRSEKKTHGGGHIYPGATFTYWKISAQSARQLVQQAFGPRAVPPRMGYETILPDTTHRGPDGVLRRVKPIVSHDSKGYEFRFWYY